MHTLVNIAVPMVILAICKAGESHPNSCTCYPSRMDCRNVSLHHIPEKLENCTVEALDLSHNSIEDITDEDMEVFKDIISLDLSYNKITSVSNGSFSTLVNLKLLNISHCHLTYLPDDIFLNNIVLEVLDLSSNNLESVPNLPHSIERLYISSSNISHLSPFHLPMLKYLNVNNNNLKQISLETRKSLSNVTEVVVNTNPWECSKEFEDLMCWVYYKSGEKPDHIECSWKFGSREIYSLDDILNKCDQNTQTSESTIDLSVTIENEYFLEDENTINTSTTQVHELQDHITKQHEEKQKNSSEVIFSTSDIQNCTNNENTTENIQAAMPEGSEKEVSRNDSEDSDTTGDSPEDTTQNEEKSKNGTAVTFPTTEDQRYDINNRKTTESVQTLISKQSTGEVSRKGQDTNTPDLDMDEKLARRVNEQELQVTNGVASYGTHIVKGEDIKELPQTHQANSNIILGVIITVIAVSIFINVVLILYKRQRRSHKDTSRVHYYINSQNPAVHIEVGNSSEAEENCRLVKNHREEKQ